MHMQVLSERNSGKKKSCYVHPYATNVGTDNEIRTETHVCDLRTYVWMDERCFRPLLCTVKAELGRGQPGLMR